MEDYIIDIIEDLAKEYFQNNNNNYNISKAVLSNKLELGSTKTEAVCKELEIEYPFIENGRGFIIIDKKGFLEWEILREEQSKHITTFVELTTKYPQLAKSIEYYKGEIEKKGNLVSEKDKESQELNNQAKELENKVNGLENSIKEAKDKLGNLNLQYDKLKEENDLALKEYNEKTGAEIQRLKEEAKDKKEEAEAKLNKAKEEIKKGRDELDRKVKEEQAIIENSRREAQRREAEKSFFFRRNISDYQYDKSKFDKFLGEALRFIAYGLIFSAIMYYL